MTHPAFIGMPDASLAEACTDIFDKPFKFTSTQEIADLYGEGGFPPVPAHLTSITAAYLEAMPSGKVNIRKQFTCVRPDLVSLTEVADLYENNVGYFQESTAILETIGSLNPQFNEYDAGINGVQSWYVHKIANTGGRLLAAHIIARTIDDDHLIDTVAIPNKVFEELPLLARDTVASLIPAFDEIINDEVTENADKEKLNSVVKTFLSNDPILANLGSIAASSLLPEVALLASKLRDAQTQNNTTTANKPSGNRAQRRKQNRKNN